MPFKILTYSDPYNIDQIDDWDEISTLPHLCASQVLARGIKEVLGDKIANVVVPIEKVIEREEIYNNWTNNIALKLAQYGWLSEKFHEKASNNNWNEKLLGALNKNKGSFLESLRLFIELGVKASSFRKFDDKGSNLVSIEQELFIDLLTEIQGQNIKEFQIDDRYTVLGKNKSRSVQESLLNVLRKEYQQAKDENELDDKKTKKMLRTAEYIKNWDGKSIVVHGIHQFQPLQLRFLLNLANNLGVTVIFLFNYQTKYNELYKTWETIYNNFNVNILFDQTDYMPQLGQKYNSNYVLAQCLGKMVATGKFTGDYDIINKIVCKKFDNLTSYANFISDEVETTKQRIEIDESGNSSKKLLRKMQRMIYNANDEISGLLEVYYPEYSKERHFLAYPIGQFFSSIYKLWNGTEIGIEMTYLKECFNSGILVEYDTGNLLRVAIVLEETLFRGVQSYSELIDRIDNRYLIQYDKINQEDKELDSSIRLLDIYNPNVITRQDILELRSAIVTINEVAKSLFLNCNTNGKYDFYTHFKKLAAFVESKIDKFVHKEEQELIISLLSHFKKVESHSEGLQGTIEDLKESIAYFLRQEKAKDSTKWLVKQFEQIDGDVLLSKKQSQFTGNDKKIYHFGCISDRDMNPKMDDLLPWPLTKDFIERSCMPVDLQFRVYYDSLAEKGNFMRYAFFYGLFYNLCDSEISFIESSNDNKTELYSLLRMVGINCEDYTQMSIGNPEAFEFNYESNRFVITDKTNISLLSAYMCPHKYVMDNILRPASIINGEILYKQMYQNLIGETFTKNLGFENKLVIDIDEKIEDYLLDKQEYLEDVFFFWDNNSFIEANTTAKNYIKSVLYAKKRNTPGYQLKVMDGRIRADNYFAIRRMYGVAKWSFAKDVHTPKHPNSKIRYILEQQSKNDCWEYQLNQNLNILKDIGEYVEAYINDSTLEDCKISSEWCHCCSNKNICMKGYIDNI